jgi:hypothetical protein
MFQVFFSNIFHFFIDLFSSSQKNVFEENEKEFEKEIQEISLLLEGTKCKIISAKLRGGIRIAVEGRTETFYSKNEVENFLSTLPK